MRRRYQMEAKMIRNCGSARLVGWILAGLIVSAEVCAQSYPAKPIRVIVPFPPGGAADWTTRVVANKLSEALRVGVVVENRSGAGGQLGIEAVVRSRADGYMLLVSSNGSITINPHLRKLPYDPMKDLAPVALMNIAGAAIAVNAAQPINNLQDLIRVSKEAPGGLNYSISNIGNYMHLSGELFKIMTGAVLNPVPYKGTAPATAAVVSGEVAVTVSDILSLLPYATAGRIRILATINSSRFAGFPTVAELGFPKYASDGWIGMFAPAGTPPDVVNLLNAEVNRALALPEIQDTFQKAGLYANPMKLDELRRFIAEETRQWGEVIARAQITVGE